MLQEGQRQQRSSPWANQAWALEISLDLQIVSAICPNCKILLVEATSSSFADLMTAVDTAARLCAVGVYALAGNASLLAYGSYRYGHASNLHDVVAGSNGSCGSYLCAGTIGYDGPTGLGSPAGTRAF